MARLLFIISIVFCVCVSCNDENDETKQAWDPSRTFMVSHISNCHGVMFGQEFVAGIDVELSYESGRVKVLLTERILDDAKDDLLEVLGFEETSRTMTRQEYLMFLNNFHAYLTVTPLVRKKG